MDEIATGAFAGRVSAGFGNPNFLGGFLVLALPCALWLALRHKAAWALVALSSAALLATGHKAGWLGLGFQYFAWGHLTWNSSRERPARLRFLKAWAATGILSLALGLAALPAARSRLLESFNFRHESVQFRLQTWKGAVSAFGARPLLGHGPGSFSAVYPAYRPAAAMASQVQHSYEVSHAENWILQILVESGLLGFAAFSFFLWQLLKPLWQAALKDDPLAMALFLSLGGSLVCNLASLDLFLPSTFVPFTLLAALALHRYAGPAAGIGIKAEPYAAAMLSFCLLFLSSFPALQSLAHWRASNSLMAASVLSQAHQFDAAVRKYDEALQGDPVNTEALYFKGASLLDSGKPAEALKCFDELQALAPDYVLVHDKRARAYKALGQKSEAAIEWEHQLQLDPWLLPVVQDLSGLYASQGKLVDAERILQTAQAHFPGDAQIAKNLALIQRSRRGKP
jgi:O-antigen ligase